MSETIEGNASNVIGEGNAMSDEQKRVAVERLRQAMTHLNQQPEAILALLERLEIPWEKKHFKSQGKDFLLIAWDDLLAGEARNQEQGSVFKRLYGSDVKQ